MISLQADEKEKSLIAQTHEGHSQGRQTGCDLCPGADESSEAHPHPADGGAKARASPARAGQLGIRRVTVSREQGFPP